MNSKELELQSEINRRRLLEVVFNAKAGHIGGDLSCLNVMTAIYFNYLNIDIDTLNHPNRDRFILSKGHCVEALYVTLESRGILPKSMVDTLGRFHSPLAGHPTNCLPGIEVNSGALGHGLSIGVGMALAAKMDNMTYHTYVLMGDGEQAEGSIYEAAMSANKFGLDNLVAVIDRNRLQISGLTEDVMPLENIYAKWVAFGWDVAEMNGDDMADIVRTLDALDFSNGKPHLVISHTTKGLGISYMENQACWHHGVPKNDQYQEALHEINEKIKSVEEE